MDKLLEAVLDAHGGIENWAKVTKITAQMSLGGPFWAARGGRMYIPNPPLRSIRIVSTSPLRHSPHRIVSLCWM